MRLFGGLSTGVGPGRVGISRRGNLWAGIRGGRGAAYAGALASTRRRSRKASAPTHSTLSFTVEDDGTVKLGSAIIDVEDLRAVVAASDKARKR